MLYPGGGSLPGYSNKENPMKKHLSTIVFLRIFLIGLSLLLYPTVSDYWNSLHQSRVIADYTKQVADLDNDTYDQIWEEAREYNRLLPGKTNRYRLTEEEKEEYKQLLSLSSGGVMGYIEIPSIKCHLPIYHGTDEGVLQVAIGHIEGSSLPTGGAGTHCVLSGHRGLPSAKLFSELDKMKEGDAFVLRILDEVLTYEVDRILVVEPHEMEPLEIEEGKDYCTLVTCTPYGINTHRLLVRGHRIENQEEEKPVRAAAEVVQEETTLAAPLVIAPLLLLLLIIILITTRRRK